MNKGEVWFVEFPYDDDPSKTSNRPVVVLLSKNDFIFKIGDLHPDDLKEIERAYNDFKNGK